MSIRGFKHAIDLVRGRYSNPDDADEVSHFQAFASAVVGVVIYVSFTYLGGLIAKLSPATMSVVLRIGGLLLATIGIQP